jgi:hypothetical protein
MKKIEVIQRFKHGGQTFHPGEVRLVTPEDAGYFCGLGWAKAEGIATGEPDTSPKTLEVHNSTNGVKSPKVGVK